MFKQAWLFILLIGCLAGCLVSESIYRNQSNDFTDEISQNLETELAKLQNEAEQIITQKPITWSDLNGAHYRVEDKELKAWSITDFAPDARMIADTSVLQYGQTSLGDFIVVRQILGADEVLISLLPLVRRYPITNRYLPSHLNEKVFKHYQVNVFSPEVSSGEPVTLMGKTILKVSQPAQAGPQLFTLLFGIALLISIFLILFHILQKLHYQKKFELAFLLMSFSFVAIRIAMVEFNFPARWWPTQVFSPQVFASSTYNASVGDLVLNSLGILFICGYVFFTYSRWRTLQSLLIKKNGIVKKIIGVTLLLAALFSFLYPFLFIETIFHNSDISLDITHTLLIDTLRGLAFFSLVLGSISGFFFTHVFIRLSKSLNPTIGSFLLTLGAALLLFIGYFVWEGRNYWITVVIALPYFMVLHLTRLSLNRKGAFSSLLYFFLALLAFGVQSAWSIMRFSEEEKIESQFKFAASYLIDRDVMAEYLLNESRKRISTDAFIQSRMVSPFLSRSAARQKIKQVYLSSYFDRYDVQIHLFSPAKDPLDELSLNHWTEWNHQIGNPQYTTEYEGIYFIRSASVETGKRYIAVIPVLRAGQLVGYVVLDLLLKRTIPQSVYPELLVDSRFAEYFENRDKSFAFVADGAIQSNFGNFNYERDFATNLLKEEQLYNEGIRKDGFIHTAVEDDSGQIAVVTSRVYPYFFVLTNFSFFFVLCVFLLALLLISYGIHVWLTGKSINYATRIQLYIYLAFALPLIVVAITTLNRVSRSAEMQLTQEYLNKARVLGENLLPALTEYVHNPEENRSEWEDRLSAAARFADVDVSVFDRREMVASSQPAIAEGLLSSGLMNRTAWERVYERGDMAFVVNDKIGSLNFNNAFFALRSPETLDILGVISLPFFESAQSLDATQITVLANILTVFTLIFIIFSMLSFYVVEALTFPLRLITRTLRHTTLTTNKKLEWKSSDEIGLMVNEYNKMVDNLEQSKIELARSQKESAWREIARQVAHEIKNPLTPMKLTLQQMQLWLVKDTLEKERAKQSVNTLLNQVEILNEIASSFSAFARMPAPILEKLDLVALLTKTVNLYSTYEGGSVDFKSSVQPVYIDGDPQLLDRIFSNMILNGLQAGGKPPLVFIEVKPAGSFIRVIIQDNGEGIAPEFQDKIFIPYFTTKKSGSGLGLAIAKQGIELSGGKIWFDSSPGKTRFYLEFPVI